MAHKGTNLEQAKAHNLRSVLSEIRTGDSLSRADIAKRTGLTRQTISNLVDDLLLVSLIKEGPLRKNGAGKPSRILEFCSNGAFSIGLRVEHHHIGITLCDISGNIVHNTLKRIKFETEDELFNLLEPLCLDLIRTTQTNITRVIGIGLIMAEFDDRNEISRSLAVINPQNIAKRLYEELHLPVMLETAAAAAALAEFIQGCARNFNHFIYLFVGQEITAGLMVDGKIYRGRSARAGSIGHLVVNVNGPICTCGNPGCLNGYASLHALAKHLQKEVHLPAPYGNVFENYEMNDPRILNWLNNNAEYLRIGINSLENLYDPETIILGGDAPEWFLEAIIRHLRPFMRSVSEKGERDVPRLIKSPTAEQIVQKGAATLPVFAALGVENPSYQAGECYGDPYQKLSELINNRP